DIAGRYIQRTAGELGGLRELIAKVRAGNNAAAKEVEQLAHKIYGSGSMFGFEAVSEQARELELAAREAVDPQMVDRLQTLADALEARVQAALRARGAPRSKAGNTHPPSLSYSRVSASTPSPSTPAPRFPAPTGGRAKPASSAVASTSAPTLRCIRCCTKRVTSSAWTIPVARHSIAMRAATN